MEKIYSRIVRIVSIIIIGYLFLQGLFTICNMQRVTERVYYMKNNPWRQLLCIGIVILLCLAARKFKAKEFLDRYDTMFSMSVLQAWFSSCYGGSVRQASGSLVIRKRFICVPELFSEEILLPGNREAMLTCGRTRTA